MISFWSMVTFITLSFILAAPVLNDNLRDIAGLLRNPTHVAIVANASFLTVLGAGMLFQWILLGSLRSSDKVRITSELWSCAVETVLLLTVFRTELSFNFFATLLAVSFLRPFHWVCQERSGKLGQGSSVVQQARYCFATGTLLTLDASLIYITLVQNTTPLLFLTELTIMVLDLLHAFSTYILSISTYDDNTSQRFVPQLFVQMVFDGARMLVHVPFLGLTVRHYALPIHTIKDIYLESKSVSVAWSGIAKAHEARRWLEALAPIPSSPQPSSSQPDGLRGTTGGEVGDDSAALIKGDDTTCLVCREDMLLDDSTSPIDQSQRPRVLPCQHAFHLECLKVWMERQQSCPTCRTKVRPILSRINASSSSLKRIRPAMSKRKPSLPPSPIS